MRFLVALLICSSAHGVSYWASPTATAGAGTFADPWKVSIAATNDVITAGDSLLIRGGTNRGFVYIDLNANASGRVTIKPHTNEAVTLTDGIIGDLRTTMTTLTTSIVVEDAHEFRPAVDGQGGQIIIGHENLRINSKSSPTNLVVERAINGTTAAAHSIGDRVIAKGDIVTMVGTNCTLQGFTITSVQATNREIAPGGSNTWYVSGGVNCPISGIGNSVIGNHIHNVGHPAVSFWKQGAGAEVTGNIFSGVGFYDWNGAQWIRGTCVYGQSEAGFAQIKRNMVFNIFTDGLEFFGETGPVKECAIIENIVGRCATSYPTYEAVSGSTSTSNVLVHTNWCIGSPLLSYASFTNRLTYFVGNWIVEGAFTLNEFETATVTNNTVLMPNAGVGGSPIGYDSNLFSTNDVTIDWNRNTYYQKAGASAFNWAVDYADMTAVNSMGGGNLKFTNDVNKSWQDWSRFDLNSVWDDEWPTNIQQVFARQLEHDETRVHVCVINTSQDTTNATLSLSSFGYEIGQTYILRDGQDYLNPITTGTWNGVSINLPLNRTNVAEFAGSMTHNTNEHSNVDFPGLLNGFVIERQAASFGDLTFERGHPKLRGVRLKL